MSTIGATDPVQELNITVSSVRRRFNGKWLAFLLPKGTGGLQGGEERERERRTQTDTNRQTHTRIPQRGKRQRGSEGRERERYPQSSAAPPSWNLPGRRQHVGPQPVGLGILPAALLLLCFLSDCKRWQCLLSFSR